jgi:hypothetical protein
MLTVLVEPAQPLGTHPDPPTHCDLCGGTLHKYFVQGSTVKTHSRTVCVTCADDLRKCWTQQCDHWILHDDGYYRRN